MAKRQSVASCSLLVLLLGAPLLLGGALAQDFSKVPAACDGVWLAEPSATSASTSGSDTVNMATAVSAMAVGGSPPFSCRFASNPDSMLGVGTKPTVVQGMAGLLKPVQGNSVGVPGAQYLAFTNRGVFAAHSTRGQDGLPLIQFYKAQVHFIEPHSTTDKTAPTPVNPPRNDAATFDASAKGCTCTNCTFLYVGGVAGTNKGAITCACTGCMKLGQKAQDVLSALSQEGRGDDDKDSYILRTHRLRLCLRAPGACALDWARRHGGPRVEDGAAGSGGVLAGLTSNVQVSVDTAIPPAFTWSLVTAPAPPAGAPQVVLAGVFANATSGALLACDESARVPGASACLLKTAKGAFPATTTLTLFQTSENGYATWEAYTHTGEQLTVTLAPTGDEVYVTAPGAVLSMQRVRPLQKA